MTRVTENRAGVLVSLEAATVSTGAADAGRIPQLNAAGEIDATMIPAGIPAGDAAELNGEPGTYYLARANHTGTQLAATISDFNSAADARVAAAVGVTVQAFDNDLAALAALAGNGIIVKTGAGTVSNRSIAGTANQISVADGDGVGGTPTLSLPSAVTMPGSLTVTTTLNVNGTATIGDAAGDTHAVNGAMTFNARSQHALGATMRSGNTTQWNNAADNASASASFDGTSLLLSAPIVVTGTGSFSGGLVAGTTVVTAPAAGSNDNKLAAMSNVRAAGSFAVYRTVAEASGSHIAARVAGTYFFAEGDALAISGTGTLYPPLLIYIDSADYPSVDGLSPKLRIEAICAVNDTAPGGGGSFTFGLHPVTTPGTSGAAGVRIWTVGAAVASSTTAFSTPAADSAARQVSADFALPSNGLYVLGMVSSATVNVNSHMHLTARLHMRYA